MTAQTSPLLAALDAIEETARRATPIQPQRPGEGRVRTT